MGGLYVASGRIYPCMAMDTMYVFYMMNIECSIVKIVVCGVPGASFLLFCDKEVLI